MSTVARWISPTLSGCCCKTTYLQNAAEKWYCLPVVLSFCSSLQLYVLFAVLVLTMIHHTWIVHLIWICLLLPCPFTLWISFNRWRPSSLYCRSSTPTAATDWGKLADPFYSGLLQVWLPLYSVHTCLFVWLGHTNLCCKHVIKYHGIVYKASPLNLY